MNKKNLFLALALCLALMFMTNVIPVHAATTSTTILENFDNTAPFPGKYTYYETDSGGKLKGYQADNVYGSAPYSYMLEDIKSAVADVDNQTILIPINLTNMENIRYTLWWRNPDGGFGQEFYVYLDSTLLFKRNGVGITSTITKIGDFENNIKPYGLSGVHEIRIMIKYTLNRAGNESCWFLADNIAGDDNSPPPPPPFKGMGKPSLYLPENDSAFILGHNINFEWSIGENSENSRLEVFNSLGVCIDNQTQAITDNTYTKIGGYGCDNYTWRVWAENRNLNNGAENVSLSIFTFEYAPVTPATPTPATPVDVAGLIIFFLPWVLCVLALRFDNPTLAGLGGFTFMFAGIYYITSAWAGISLIGLGAIFLYSILKT